MATFSQLLAKSKN